MFSSDLLIWGLFIACVAVVAVVTVTQIIVAVVRGKRIARAPFIVLAIYAAIIILRVIGILDGFTGGVIGLIVTVLVLGVGLTALLTSRRR